MGCCTFRAHPVRNRDGAGAAAFSYYLAKDAVRVGLARDEAAQAVAGTKLPLPKLARFLDLALQQHIQPAELEKIIPTREQTPIPGTDL